MTSSEGAHSVGKTAPRASIARGPSCAAWPRRSIVRGGACRHAAARGGGRAKKSPLLCADAGPGFTVADHPRQVVGMIDATLAPGSS
jgi:hypothetical protein